jgi:hypothetical protein
MSLKNFWSVFTGGNLNTTEKSTGILRGGPMMKLPGEMSTRLGFSSDERKKLEFSAFMNYNFGLRKNSRNVYSEIEISYKPINYLSLSILPGMSVNSSELQYVTNEIKYNNETRYVFASIDRKTISTSFRINLNLSPNLTFQYWGQPFIATGKYYDYKYITNPIAERYEDRFCIYSDDQKSLNSDNKFDVDENHDGNYSDYQFDRKDFNVQEFLSNLVIRWEFNPGSSLYLVWSQTRSNSNDTGQLKFFNDLGDLFSNADEKPHNVFLVKFSYRIGLK